MQKNSYKLYIEDTVKLAETIIIKSSISADGVNKKIVDYYGKDKVNFLDKTSWKYYKNLAGEYHLLDEEMYVTSMDTLEEIPFTKASLRTHRATYKGYLFGTRAYYELIDKYPQHEQLIIGILYPVDINKAIAAEDGQILGYPSYLVETNEYSLISKLQDFINRYKIRWTNNQFAISDPLYPAMSLGILYLNIIPAILTSRLEACKTNEAHSFHIRQYLGSHGFLDRFLEVMTLKQALFFYRNIAYIERNLGNRDVFSWLIDHIMTERGLPLAEYTMRHDLSVLPDNYYPQLIFTKKSVNFNYSNANIDEISLEELFTKEDKEARDNTKYKYELMEDCHEMMKNSLSNVLATKSLESSIIDLTDSEAITLSEILINHWIYLSSNNMYRAFIGFNNPQTSERYVMSTREACILYWYVFCKSIGIELVAIPKIFAMHVQRIPMLSLSDILRVVPKGFDCTAEANVIADIQPKIEPFISVDAFYEVCKKIFEATRIQRNLVAIQEHLFKRAIVQNMTVQMYSDNYCTLNAADETYAEWLSARSINLNGMTENNLVLLYSEILQEATGIELNSTSSLKNLQKSMITILKQLSSYSIEIIPTINSSSIKRTDQTVVRVGDIDGTAEQQAYVDLSGITVFNDQQLISHEIDYDVNSPMIGDEIDIKLTNKYFIDLGVTISDTKPEHVYNYRLDIYPIRGKATKPLIANAENVIAVEGIEEYLKLNTIERHDFKDIYTTFNPQIIDAETAALELLSGFYMVDGYVADGYLRDE